MKVLALTNYLSARGGGIPPAILRLYELLEVKGVEVVLAASDQPSHVARTRVVTFRSTGPKSFGFSWELIDILERERPDIVHLHGLWTFGSIAVQIWKHRTGNPVVVSTHGMLDRWALRHRALKKTIAGAAYEWRNLRNASCIHALSEGEVESLHDFGFRDHVVKIPNGVDLRQSFEPRKPGKRIVLYLGRLHPKKGIAESLIAWSFFQKEFGIAPERWQFVIAGWDDGGHQDELYKIVTKFNLEEHVQFVGPVFDAEKDGLYASADAMILASYSEGLPMSVLEAWSFGKPTFMTEQCNLPEAFVAGAAFRITNDPKNIAGTLIDVLPDMPRLNAAGIAARALAETSFNWMEISHRWLSLYSSLLCQANAG
jgi:glycosyltransferase involved in cell wall biosynthesis